MRKLIRPTYPPQFSAGLLLLIFAITFFLSHQIFTVPFSELEDNKDVYFGMFLVGVAVITMILVVWEEFLFPIKVREVEGGMIFRNHRNKLKTQLLIYCFIPAIFTFIYMEYEINYFRFFVLAVICTVTPILEKIASGINNYNDFLLLTNKEVQYKNNEKEGCYKLKDIDTISIIKDEGNTIKKIQLVLTTYDTVIIDLDEMELDAFYTSITKFIRTNYQDFLKESSTSSTAQ